MQENNDCSTRMKSEYEYQNVENTKTKQACPKTQNKLNYNKLRPISTFYILMIVHSLVLCEFENIDLQ